MVLGALAPRHRTLFNIVTAILSIVTAFFNIVTAILSIVTAFFNIVTANLIL